MNNHTIVTGTTARDQNKLATARKKMKSGFADAHDLKCISDDFEARLNSAMKKHGMLDV